MYQPSPPMKPVGSTLRYSAWNKIFAIAVLVSCCLWPLLSSPSGAVCSAMVVVPKGRDSPSPPPPDAAMASTYDRLAQRAIDLYRSQKGSGTGGRVWIGIAGGPGAGKSTLAAAVADNISSKKETVADPSDQTETTIRAVAVPMDGYHYTRSQLAEVAAKFDPKHDDGSKGMSRRGAIWTFDAKGLARDLSAAKAAGHASLPEYDRKLSDPVSDAVQIEASHQIVLVEGNYLILGTLAAELEGEEAKPGSPLSAACAQLRCPVPIGKEIERWREVAGLWDETWFVAPPGTTPSEVKIQRDRVVERSLATWTPAKTKAWGGATDREAAEKRADFNDVPNARLVACCQNYADLVVDSL